MNGTSAPAIPSRDWKGWIVFFVLSFVWGGSFILIKKGLISFTPFEVATLRILLSAVAFVPIFIISGVKFPKGKVLMVTAVVFTGNGIPAFLFALAETRLGSAVTGVINSLTPVFALLVGIFFFEVRLRRNHVIGVLLGCMGIAVLMIGEKHWHVSSYILWVVLGTLCYGISANLVKRYCQDIHPIALSAAGFFILGGIAAIVLGFAGTHHKLREAEVWSISMPALIALSLICTVFANILFFWLIQRTTAVFGSAIAYAIPCMALVWGSLDGEQIHIYQLAGFGFIIAAIYTLRRH